MLADHQFKNVTAFGPVLCNGFWWINYKPLTCTKRVNLAALGWGLVMLVHITGSLLFHGSAPLSAPNPDPHPPTSVSRETIRSKKKSDYNLNKTNAPILTNTTLNVIRLVGESRAHTNAHLCHSALLESTQPGWVSSLRSPFIRRWCRQLIAIATLKGRLQLVWLSCTNNG